MSFINHIKWLLLSVVVTVLTACGGGGGSTSGNQDVIPVASISLPDQTDVALTSIVESNTTTLRDINSSATISVTSGSSYRINGGIYTDAAGTVHNGDSVQVRHISSENFSTSVSTTLTIGGVQMTFKSTTLSKDTTTIATLNVKDFGAVGDGVSDDTIAVKNAISAALAAGKNLYFPNGAYLYQGIMNGQGIRFIGQSKTGTILKDTSVNQGHNIDGAENITFQDFKISDYYGVSKSRIFRNCKFQITLPVDGSYYMFYTGYYTIGANNEFTDCDFVFPKIYSALWIRKYDSVLIQNCTFNGNASHNIRLESPNKRDAQVSIIGNTITGGKTGIFIGSNCEIPMEGGLIEGNTLHDQYEEAIALDGFGNNSGLIPVIANGPIAGAKNDANGRVVISMDQMVYNNPSAPSPVSLRSDWTNFYFSFGEGSGLEGSVANIRDFNTSENTLTLDLITPASTIKSGGDTGVQGGFFNWIIRRNTITGTLGDNNIYGTAISVYLNVFGILVENNTISNCAHGVNLAGGQMLTTYRTLAYGNVIRNNTFQNCDRYATGNPSEEVGVVRFSSYYSGGGPLQYNNQFINNTVDGGRIFIERQKNLTWEGNILTNVNLKIVEP